MPVRRLRFARSLALLALAAAARPASAQRALASVGASEHVQVRTPGLVLTGTVVSATPDSLLLQTVTGSRTDQHFLQRSVPVSCMESLRVSTGPASPKRWGITGGAIGLATGVGAGMMIGAITAHTRDPRGPKVAYGPVYYPDLWQIVRTRALWFGTGGMIAGATAGYTLRPERWRGVALPASAGSGVGTPTCAAYRR